METTEKQTLSTEQNPETISSERADMARMIKEACLFAREKATGNAMQAKVSLFQNDRIEESLQNDEESKSRGLSIETTQKLHVDSLRGSQNSNGKQDLRYHELKVHQSLEHLFIEDESMILLQGLQGAGKSSIAQKTQFLVNKRKLASAGSTCIECKSINDTQTLCKTMFRRLADQVKLDKHLKSKFQNKISSKEDLMKLLVSIMNCDQESNAQNRELEIKKTQLLVLDNIEGLIFSDFARFKKFLTRLNNECANLKVIMTSNRGLGQLDNGITPRVLNVSRLSHLDSVSLFLDNSGQLESNEQLIEFLLADPNYPFDKFLPKLTDSSGQNLSPESKEQIMQMIRAPQSLKMALSLHGMFKLACGNSYAISTLARVYRFLQQNQRSDNCLLEVYNRFKFHSEAMYLERPQSDNIEALNNCSVRSATQMTIDFLKHEDKSYFHLVELMTCLPGGASTSQLKSIVGHEVDDQITTLKDLSVLTEVQVDTSDRLLINPFLMGHIEIEDAIKERSVKAICHYYHGSLRASHDQLVKKTKETFSLTTRQKSGDLFELLSPENENLFQAEMENILFCLDYSLVSQDCEESSDVLDQHLIQDVSKLKEQTETLNAGHTAKNHHEEQSNRQWQKCGQESDQIIEEESEGSEQDAEKSSEIPDQTNQNDVSPLGSEGSDSEKMDEPQSMQDSHETTIKPTQPARTAQVPVDNSLQAMLKAYPKAALKRDGVQAHEQKLGNEKAGFSKRKPIQVLSFQFGQKRPLKQSAAPSQIVEEREEQKMGDYSLNAASMIFNEEESKEKSRVKSQQKSSEMQEQSEESDSSHEQDDGESNRADQESHIAENGFGHMVQEESDEESDSEQNELNDTHPLETKHKSKTCSQSSNLPKNIQAESPNDTSARLGELVLLAAVCYLLRGDVDSSRELSRKAIKKFKNLSDDQLLIGNMNRLHSLSCIQLLYQTDDDAEYSFDRAMLVMESIESLSKAKRCFEKNIRLSDWERNYGLALTLFQEGFVYSEITATLIPVEFLKVAEQSEDLRREGLVDRQTCQQKACQLFEVSAFGGFKEINHLQAMALCEKMAAKVKERCQEESKGMEEEQSQREGQTQESRTQILREFSEEVCLMTELVFQCQDAAMSTTYE